MERYQIVKEGDIIQITDERDGLYGCLLIVERVTARNVRAYTASPKEGFENSGSYPVRFDAFAVVGKAAVVQD